jgi:hypothetical protein
VLFTKVFHQDTEHVNERLELSDKGSLYFLGPRLTMRDCSLLLKVPARNLLIQDARFIGCTFEVKQELSNHQQWVFASLQGCRFTGRLSGCDFGRWPGFSSGWEHGLIEDCDFSEARLDACRFHGCAPDSLRLPRWPCFTLLDPVVHGDELARGPWPTRFGRAVIEDLARYPPSTTALTFFAPAVARRFETTEEELRAVVEKFDCIVY